MLVPGFGFELAKFIGEKGLDFALGKAEMKRLGHELLHSRLNLPPARLQPQRRRLVRHVGAEAAPRLHKPVTFEQLVDLAHGEGIEPQLRGEIAHGGQLLPVGQLAGQDALLHLLLQLHIKWHAAGGVEQIHGVLVI